MKVNVEDFDYALEIIDDAGGAEATIVAKFALGLAVLASGATLLLQNVNPRKTLATPPDVIVGWNRTQSCCVW